MWGDERIPEAFWNKVIPEPNTGCWLWFACIRKCDGYGHYVSPRPEQRTYLSHRYAYLKLIGPIADGLQLDHLCRQRCCVNPQHLEPVTKEENQRRGMCGVLKTHCKNGHPFDERNTRFYKAVNRFPQRVCRVCNAAAVRRYQARKVEAQP